MQDVDLIALAIPFFLASMAVEVAWTKIFGPKDAYRVADSIANISAGIGDEVLGVFTTALTFATYILLYDQFRFATLDAAHWSTWVFALLAVDFIYFLWHWSSHRINLVWATHVVHHQSEEYNLSVALRQSWTDAFTSWPLYLPLALAGVSPFVLIVCRSLNTLYQFWVHTRAIGRLGPLEWFMVTPSNHRVHHARNPKYIDRNYGGILCVWDRLFRTFAAEEEEPVYGTVTPLASWNAFHAQTWYFTKLWAMSKQANSLAESLYIWIAPPEYLPGGGRAEIPEITRDTQHKYDTDTDTAVLAYASVHFLLPIAVVTMMLFMGDSATVHSQLLLAMLAWLSLLSASGLTEHRPWSRPVELIRLAFLAALPVVTQLPIALAAVVCAFCVISATWIVLRGPPRALSAA